MKRTLLALALLLPTAAFADPAHGPTVARMQADWADFDAACRGTSPAQGADRFCGARDYIGWALARKNVCLNESAGGSDFWVPCTVSGAYGTRDPIPADVRADF